jgi:UDP-glucose 4-epimerase
LKILITGAAGFIGSHLVDFFLKKKKIKSITGIDNLEDGSLKNLKEANKSTKFKFYKANLCNLKSVQKLFKNIDYVFHLAAYSDVVPSINHPRDYMYNNIVSTLNVLSCMKKYKIKKIIFAASSSCYGIPKTYPTKESEKIDCKYPYSKSKNICEDIIIHWSKIYKFRYISLRLFNVYGVRSRTNSAYGAALGVFLKQKLSRKPFTIVGNGNQKRDFIYVTDVCKAFYKSLNKNVSNKIFNIGSGKPKSINYLISLIKGEKIFIKKRPGEPFITHANISKAKKYLNWRPLISLEDGIKIVLDDILYWKKAPLWDKKKIYSATKEWFRYLKNF